MGFSALDGFWWKLWLASFLCLLFLSIPLQRSRRFHGRSTGGFTWADCLIRALILYAVFFGPVIAWAPKIFFPLFLLYLPSYLDGSERTGARYNTPIGRWCRRWTCWRLWAKAWDMELVVDDPNFDKKRQYIYALHPHAILPLGSGVALATDYCGADTRLTGTRYGLGASMVFLVPLWRDLFLYTGVIDASKANAVAALKRGISLVVCPGGATESLLSHPHTHALYLARRQGFVRLAIESGASLLPCYTFGEINAWNTLIVGADRVVRLDDGECPSVTDEPTATRGKGTVTESADGKGEGSAHVAVKSADGKESDVEVVGKVGGGGAGAVKQRKGGAKGKGGDVDSSSASAAVATATPAKGVGEGEERSGGSAGKKRGRKVRRVPLRQLAKTIPPSLSRPPKTVFERGLVSVRTWVQASFGFTLPMLTHLKPRKVKMVTVVGPAVKVVQNDKPSDEQVEETFQRYVDALEALFVKYAPKYEPEVKARQLYIY